MIILKVSKVVEGFEYNNDEQRYNLIIKKLPQLSREKIDIIINAYREIVFEVKHIKEVVEYAQNIIDTCNGEIINRRNKKIDDILNK